MPRVGWQSCAETRKAGEAARARERQAAAPSQDEAEESDATEEEATRERTTRVGRPRGGGMKEVAARIGERLRREIRAYYLLITANFGHNFHIIAETLRAQKVAGRA